MLNIQSNNSRNEGKIIREGIVKCGGDGGQSQQELEVN